MKDFATRGFSFSGKCYLKDRVFVVLFFGLSVWIPSSLLNVCMMMNRGVWFFGLSICDVCVWIPFF